MPRKAVDDWQADERGRYCRKVGWWTDRQRKRKQYPFHFGTDKAQACARLVRVMELWARIVDRHSQPQELGAGGLPLVADGDRREPTWNGDALWIARQLAAGTVQVVVERGSLRDEAYALRLHHLAKDYPFVQFVPEDQGSYTDGSQFLKKARQSQLEKMPPLVGDNLTTEITENLHAALDAYATHIEKTDLEPGPDGPGLSSFGALKIGQVSQLKRRHKDRPLSNLDYDGCQELIDFWRLRPLTSDKRIKPARPMAKKSCENHISELMRFFRWLHKSKNFNWRKPEDFDDLRTVVKDIQEERTSISHTKIKVYLPDELAVLNKYATPLERVLLLLGLNCGFRGAEQGTLLLDHLFLDEVHPNSKYLKEIAKFECRPEDRFVLYRRNKTKVYGEFLLWDQTVEILRWAVQRQRQICLKHGLQYRNVLVTERGTLFFRLTAGNKNLSQIFGNKWDALIKRIRKDHPDFPDHSFSSLRDTASDLVRQVAGGEVAAVFLMHGQPVKADDLLDLYTNRPFGRVFETLRTLQQELKVVFDAAPASVVEQPVRQHTSLGQRERIVELKKQGRRVSEIMAETGVSRMTVFRTLDRLWFAPTNRKSK